MEVHFIVHHLHCLGPLLVITAQMEADLIIHHVIHLKGCTVSVPFWSSQGCTV